MCGLAGFVGPGDRDDLRAMMDVLAHRGPDGSGEFYDERLPLHLGHRRLSIVDIDGGSQPMWNAAKSIAVIFNGEIFNHRELRAELESKGHRFLTDHSDTEVLIHGYAQWGTELPARLNGQFAFCIYDRIRKRLFLSRDRFGEKPLYFARQGNLFAFASELSAIASHSHFEARLDQRSLQKFFAHGFVPAPGAILKDCEKLPGGSGLTFDIPTGDIRRFRYWQFRLEPDNALLERRDDELAEELRGLLFESVRRRLMADVPLGVFLSGGIDSGAALAGAAQFRDADQLKCFTIGFTERSFDESAQAKLVAEKFGAHHAVKYLDFDKARLLIPQILGCLDEPLGDPSILPTYLLSHYTRERVKVALSGDGGDELFAGYDPFSALAPARLYQSCVPLPLHKILQEAVRFLPISPRNMSLDFKLRRTLTGLSHPPHFWNPVWLAPADPKLIAQLFQEPLAPEDLYSEALQLWQEGSGLSLIDRSLEFYTNFYLQDNILMKVDRASMMCSLESRAIFLDNDLVEFCRRLPSHFKKRGRTRKFLLKKALRGHLPDSSLTRAKKGFGIPSAKWLRALAAAPPLAPVTGVRMDEIATSWNAHAVGSADHRLLLWSWLSLQSLTYPLQAAS